MYSFHTNQFHCYSLSERAITIEFGNEISDNLLAVVTRCNELLLRSPFPGFVTTTPAYATLTVFYDPAITGASELPGADCVKKISGYITHLLIENEEAGLSAGNTIIVPVCYGGTYGPDLSDVAKYNQISIDEVVRLHSGGIYKVYMIGFLPGFSYLGGMAPQLATPRKATPRRCVPAGSVGIAGQQTGVYPLESPGGWQLIGQTPISMFNFKRSAPALLKAGDTVKFKPISVDQFKELVG
jgi:inhibitor of KinA